MNFNPYLQDCALGLKFSAESMVYLAVESQLKMKITEK